MEMCCFSNCAASGLKLLFKTERLEPCIIAIWNHNVFTTQEIALEWRCANLMLSISVQYVPKLLDPISENA